MHARVAAECAAYRAQYRRSVHITPRSFTASVAAFAALYGRKLRELRGRAADIAAGLAKMDAAKVDVGRLEAALGKQDLELAAARAAAGALLAEIEASAAAAERERAKVGALVAAVRAQAAAIAAAKADAEADLAAARPALDAALAALDSIAPKDIVALKALRSPPDVVKRIFDCVLLLRHLRVGPAAWREHKGAQVLEGSYEEAVRMMGEMGFLQRLVAFPKEQINDETVELLQVGGWWLVVGGWRLAVGRLGNG